MVQLRRRLVIPRAPGLAAVHSDDRALIRTQKNDVGIVGIDPNVLIIVPAGRAAPALPRFAAVRRFPTNYTRRVDNLWILWIEPHHRQIAATDSKSWPWIAGCAAPVFAAIVGAIKFSNRLRPYRGEQCFRRARRDDNIRRP